ncbi:MAG: hypothetical protein RhofKO_38810 [Rhodothermales bacterium]
MEAGVVDAPLHRLAQIIWPASAPTEPRAAAEKVLYHIESLVTSLQLPPFASFGIPASMYSRLAAGAVHNGSNASNPQPMGAADYLAILNRL